MGNRLKSRLFYASLLSIVFVGYQNCSDISVTPESSEVLPHLSLSMKICYESDEYIKSIYVMNTSSAFDTDGRAKLDSDRDGLVDVFEGQKSNVQTYGISYLSRDANADGYSDLLQVRAGIFRDQVNNLAACGDPALDTDSDGMPDCEEAVARTLIDNPDSDADGIPDYVEYRVGLNPTEALDAHTNVDGDSMDAFEEIKNNLPVYGSNQEHNEIHRYLWTTEFTEDENQNQCEIVTVSNIALYPARNGNQIKAFVMMSNQLGEDRMRNIVVTTHPSDFADKNVTAELNLLDEIVINLPAQVEGL